MSFDEFKARLDEWAQRRCSAVPSVDAMVSARSDPLRSVFMRVMTTDFQETLQGLTREVVRRQDQSARLSAASDWLTKRHLNAPWIFEWLKGTEPEYWQTPGKPVVILGPSPLNARDADQRPPIVELDAPQPWLETKSDFEKRYKRAWNANYSWAKEHGFEPRPRIRKKEHLRELIRALLKNRLDRLSFEKMLEGRVAVAGIRDTEALRKKAAALAERLGLPRVGRPRR